MFNHSLSVNEVRLVRGKSMWGSVEDLGYGTKLKGMRGVHVNISNTIQVTCRFNYNIIILSMCRQKPESVAWYWH
jgi:hypothetical protein